MKGKVKELFEEFIRKSKYYNNNSMIHSYDLSLSEYHPSMQWGVMQDFYDSQGMNVYLYKFTHVFTFMIDGFEYKNYNQVIEFKECFSVEYKTRQEARKAAEEKAEEILNDRL